MSLTAQIGSSEVAFKLTQKVVASLAEKFGFSFEAGWETISTRTVDNIQKRMKRDKRRANPTSSIKHPRTSFSFFTQRQRPISQAAHPAATFGELSRFVSEAWKALTPEQMAEYKALETSDKLRYQTERDALLAATPAASEVAVPVVAEASEVAAPAKAKKAKTPKAEAAVAPAAAVVATPAKEDKPKSAKSSKSKPSTPVAPVVAAVVAAEEAKPAKAPKAKKTEAKPVEVVAEPVVAKAAKETKAPKEAKAPKTPKAVKA